MRWRQLSFMLALMGCVPKHRAPPPLVQAIDDPCAEAMQARAEWEPRVVLGPRGPLNVASFIERPSRPPDCPEAVVKVPGPPCGAQACGNDLRDECLECRSSHAGDPTLGDGSIAVEASPQVETCDGADLGGATCTSLGFAGGELACSSTCAFDVTGCHPCRDIPEVLACGHLPIDAPAPALLALGVSDGRIGAAWIDRAGRVRFALLDRQLEVLSPTGCVGSQGTLDALAMSPTGRGWLIAHELSTKGEGETEVLALDHQGVLLGSPVTMSGDRPRLARAPDGTLLLVRGYLATIVDELGAPLASMEHLGVSETADVAWVGDAFLVVGVQRDGRAPLARVTPRGELTRLPALRIDRGGPVALEDSPGPARLLLTRPARWLRLDAQGTPLGEPVPEPRYDALRHTVSSPLLRAGGDLLIVRSEDQVGLAVLPPGPDLPTPTPLVFTQDPDHPSKLEMALDGDAVIVGWLDRSFPGEIKLARLCLGTTTIAVD